MNPRWIRKRTFVAAVCVIGATSGCISTSYTYYEPTAANARFAPGHSCAGPHDLAIFPPELGGIQVGVVVSDPRSPLELWFEIRNDFARPGPFVSEEWRQDHQAMREHVFDIYSPSPALSVTFADGTKMNLDIPYLEGVQHRSYVDGKVQGVPSSLIKWPLPPKAVDGFDVLLPDIFVDGKLIPTSPIRFKRTTKVLVEGINC